VRSAVTNPASATPKPSAKTTSAAMGGRRVGDLASVRAGPVDAAAAVFYFVASPRLASLGPAPAGDAGRTERGKILVAKELT
jgi:hypothetical protein